MTPAQLEHLKLIDTHLERLLAIAEKRTPGEWKEGNGAVWHDCNNESQNEVCEFVSPQNAAFIASCAGNAEAGWRATRAAIVAIRLTVPPHCPQSLLRENDDVRTAYNLMTDILAAFPLELVTP
jgi:hypothetical protein